MAIFHMVEKVRAAWLEKKVSLGVFIDLKKAFDTVDHEILAKKLEHYGVRGQTLKLIRSYLADRTQYVSYGGFESDRGKVICGVPQGSVLGPLFFLLYVNDMVAACRELDLVLFADDTSIFAKARNASELFEKVNRGLVDLSKWFRCNKLTLNLKKTEYVYFGGQGTRIVPPGGLNIGGENIRRVEGARFLGVWVDEGLKWSEHIDNIRSKVSQLVGILGRATAVLGGQMIKNLYNGLVLPHLQYCLLVWGDFQEGRNAKAGEALLKCQKRIVGFIEGKRGKYHADPIFYSNSILKIGDLYKQQLRIYGWRFWNGLLPAAQASLLSRVSNVHNHNTRSAGSELFVSTDDQRSIAYRAPKEWQSLPRGLKDIKTLGNFKNQSKKALFKRYNDFYCSNKDCYVCGRK